MRAELPHSELLPARIPVARPGSNECVRLHASRAERPLPLPPSRKLKWKDRPACDAGTHLAERGSRPRGESVNGETAV
jgi:hypothetical protein